MSHEGFPLRHRGAHVPDHVRRLEEIAPSPRSEAPRRHFNGADAQLIRRCGSGSAAADAECAAFFRNLTVWVDQALGAASAHAGFDKAHLYLAMLRGVVDDVVPHPALQRMVEELAAYLAYLSSPAPPSESRTTPRRPAPPGKPTCSGVVSPRAVALSSKGVLSPRVMRSMAKDAATEAALTSPRIATKRPKKIIELSDHEEAILEVALFYQEALAQLSSQAAVSRVAGKRVLASQRHQPTLTQQWLLSTQDKRASTLKEIKSKIANDSLFPASSTTNSVPPTPSGGARVASGGLHSPSAPQTSATIHSLELSSYLSLLMLCLQETTRRIGVFSSEIAAFLWTVVTQETLQAVETLLQDVLERQQRAQRELERLRASRNSVHDAIAHCEREIQRLQAQNMRSLVVWELEKAEMTMLEQEEEWHGHCKALVLNSLLALQDDVNHATWLQLSSLSEPTGAKNTDAADAADATPESVTPPAPVETPGVPPVRYQRLPAGAALLHSRLRSRVVYITHLIVLCRSFLHLHEKRALREVMEATSTNPRWAEPPASASPPTQSLTAIDVVDPHHAHANGAMERISVSELFTLKDINDALRAIEELYATTGGSGDHSTSPSTRVLAHARGRDVSTQFPVIDPTDPLAAHGFLRALAYSTVAAGSTSPSRTPAFVRAGMTASPRRRNAEIGLARAPMGSGRRLSSAALLGEPSVPTKVLLRLHKAVAKLPRHFRDVLILPLLQSDPFPAELASSIVESLTRDEILARIQWLYGAVLDTTMAPSPSSPPVAAAASASTGSPIPLSRHLWKSWNSEQFVAFIHAAFLDRFGASDVANGEREFVRFFASIQLLFSGLDPSCGGGSGNGPSQAMDKISFFTRMTQLLQLDAPDAITGTRPPAQLFPVFFYCMYVLQQVVVTRKYIDEGGLSVDVWTVPFPSPPPAPPAPPAPPYVAPGSRSHKSRTTRALPSSPPSPSVFRSHAAHAGQFVLLESVKTLLLYLLEATSPDAAAVIDESIKFLSDRANLAKVALLSPVLPGAYEIHTTAASASPHAVSVANGELTDALILPLDFVVLTLASAWLQQHAALVDRLSVAMRAACSSPSGDMSFDEFTHVLSVGAAAPPSATPTAVRSGQLTQIYASLLARGSNGSNGGHTRNKAATVKWQELIVAVADEIDLLGIRERRELVDLRSIQQAVLRGGGWTLSPWVAKPAYRGGDAQALRRAWSANREAMREHFALTFQAENALEGVSLWQMGAARMDRVETLLQPRSSHHRSSTTTGDMGAGELAVAWRALYYLQLDHAQATPVADHVRTKKLRAATTKPSGV